jgi:hypothetical protein
MIDSAGQKTQEPFRTKTGFRRKQLRRLVRKEYIQVLTTAEKKTDADKIAHVLVRSLPRFISWFHCLRKKRQLDLKLS